VLALLQQALPQVRGRVPSPVLVLVLVLVLAPWQQQGSLLC
jgi:hypothetical protein